MIFLISINVLMTQIFTQTDWMILLFETAIYVEVIVDQLNSISFYLNVC